MLRRLSLTASLLTALLASCTRHEADKVTLIFENTPLQNRFTYPSGVYRPWKGEEIIKYVNSEGVLSSFKTTGGYDTLTVDCPPAGLELQHRYKALDFYTCLLQAGDTVRVSYNADGAPHFASSQSSQLTQLYNFGAETAKEPTNKLGISALPLLRESVTWRMTEAKLREGGLEMDYVSPDSLLFNLSVYRQRYATAIDSLKQLNQLPPTYEHYFRFKLEQLKWDTYIAGQNYNPTPPSPDKHLLGYFKDDYIPYVSYWGSVSGAINHVVKDLEGKTIPPVEIEKTVLDKKMVFSIPDPRAMYDTLAKDNILPNRTRNLALSFYLRGIKNNFPDDFETYKEKYTNHTSDFLEITKVPLKQSLPFATRFFLFLLESILCSLIFYPLYRYWIRGATTFIANRLYLLLFAVLSVVVPLLSLPVQLNVPVVLETANKMSDIGSGSWAMLLVALYMLVALYRSRSLFTQLIYIRKLRKDSWLIPQENYTLGLLQTIAQHPFAFGRTVYYGYDDYLNQPEEREKIIAHERYHLRMLHSVDNVLMLLLRALCWVNPFLSRYQRELKAQHEYAADKNAVASYGIQNYLRTLISTNPLLAQPRERFLRLYSKQVASVGDAERFALLQRRMSPWRNGLKLLAIIPIAALLVVLFSSEPISQTKELSKTTLSS